MTLFFTIGFFALLAITILVIALKAKTSKALFSLEFKHTALQSESKRLEDVAKTRSTEIFTLKQKLNDRELQIQNITLEKIALVKQNEDLIDKLSKKENIEVTVTGENSDVQIIDVDGKATVRKRRGRRPGTKKAPSKKKG